MSWQMLQYLSQHSPKICWMFWPPCFGLANKFSAKQLTNLVPVSFSQSGQMLTKILDRLAGALLPFMLAPMKFFAIGCYWLKQ